MATIGDTITGALVDLGLYPAGDTPPAEDMALGLERINEWLDSAANENLTVYTQTRVTWTITANTRDYALGSGSVIDTPRLQSPNQISSIGFQDTSYTPTYERLITLLTDDAWAAVRQKTLTSPYPEYMFYNPTLATGLVSCYPTPTSTTLEGVMYVRTQLETFAATTTTFTLPRGYARYFRTAVVLELADAFEIQPTALMIRNADRAERVVQRSNTRLIDMSIDPRAFVSRGRGRWFDINRGN